MSKYTTEVRFICETYAGREESGSYADVDEIISESREQIFGEYPIFDEQYRPVLETKILRHYYTREICAETVGLWKLWLNNKMNEIMPYYNQLYQSELLKFNPFYDIDLSTSHARNENGERKKDEERSEIGENKRIYDGAETSKMSAESNKADIASGSKDVEGSKSEIDISENSKNASQKKDTIGSSDKSHKDKYSDTPQGSIQNLENDTYLTNARIISDVDSATGSEEITSKEDGKAKAENASIEGSKEKHNDSLNSVSSNNEEFEKSNGGSETSNIANLGSNKAKEDFKSTEAYLENVQGKRGLTSYSELLNQFRKTFLNIDMEIIDKLAPLFFNLW